MKWASRPSHECRVSLEYKEREAHQFDLKAMRRSQESNGFRATFFYIYLGHIKQIDSFPRNWISIDFVLMLRSKERTTIYRIAFSFPFSIYPPTNPTFFQKPIRLCCRFTCCLFTLVSRSNCRTTQWLNYHIAIGLIWSEVKQLWDVGLSEYIHDMWNVIDFITNSLYVATVALRVVSYFQVSMAVNCVISDVRGARSVSVLTWK